ncbi:MAG: DUF2076 domain-containing protein [Siculibacillus sp.]|nr:DUF2076 domain-containing protein [Siculibacillus sp.]
MTPQDAETIRDVFAKIRAMGTQVDDVEAARLAEQELRANPAAALNLIKVVVGLEGERDDFAAHIDELNAHIDRLEAQIAGTATASRPSGGLFGGSTRGSPFGRETPAAHRSEPPTQAPTGPWDGQAPATGPWGAPQPQGGGFWGSALRTGAGVAGGLLAVEAVKGLFGGGHEAQAREGEKHGLFGGDREADRGGARDDGREPSGGIGGDAPEHGHEPLIADDIDFFAGSDDDSFA